MKSALDRSVRLPVLGLGVPLASALTLILAGCSEGVQLQKVPVSGQVVELTISGKKLEAELSLDPFARANGLMFREEKDLPADRGMLFIWPEGGREGGNEYDAGLKKRSMWMRNTSIPLTIAFIDESGKILQLEDMRPHDERRIWSKDDVRYALEMNRGWFRVNGIEPGAVIADFGEKVGGIHAQ
jgi:uncharacterized membrane protein (UPF0127 family)